MDRYFTFFFLMLTYNSFANVNVTIIQTCGMKDITVMYKNGSEGALGVKINDTTTVYDMSIDEPVYLYMIVDISSRHVERLWIDPRFNSRTVVIDNCIHSMYRMDTIPLDKDYEPYNQLQKKLRLESVNQDSALKALEYLQTEYIIAHPDSFLSIWYLARCMYHQSISSTKKLMEQIKAHTSIYTTYNEVESYIQNYSYKMTPSVGDTFWDFLSKDVAGRDFDSRSVSNKIILMDFWYSGCGPCRKMIEPLKTLYTSFRSDSVEFISYSLDAKYKEWKMASDLDNVPWINVSDIGGFNSPLAMHYSIQSYPTFIIFDKTKKIYLITFGNEIQLLSSTIQELIHKK